jgi:hypothetical protein
VVGQHLVVGLGLGPQRGLLEDRRAGDRQREDQGRHRGGQPAGVRPGVLGGEVAGHSRAAGGEAHETNPDRAEQWGEQPDHHHRRHHDRRRAPTPRR